MESTPPAQFWNQPDVEISTVNDDGVPWVNALPPHLGTTVLQTVPDVVTKSGFQETSASSCSTTSTESGNGAFLREPSQSQYKQKGHALTCDVPGCEHKGTFRREYELQRHRLTRHNGAQAKEFICDARGCFKGSSKTAFARSDKLTSHIRALHKLDAIFDRCPIRDCTVESCTLEELGLHVRRVHGDQSYYGRAIANTTSGALRQCPWWRCGKHIPSDRFLDHVQTHSVDELHIAMSSSNAGGLAIDLAPISSSHISLGSPTPHPTLRVVCPVCRVTTEGFEQFKEHLWIKHLYLESSGGSEHFLAWKSEWAKHVPKASRTKIESLSPWLELDSLGIYGSERDLKCPACPFTVNQFGKGSDLVAKKPVVANHLRVLRSHYEITSEHSVTTHHLDLLRPEAEVIHELRPYRMQILRLYPGFVTHPVFRDLDQPQT
jgi:hypothetical protein